MRHAGDLSHAIEDAHRTPHPDLREGMSIENQLVSRMTRSEAHGGVRLKPFERDRQAPCFR